MASSTLHSRYKVAKVGFDNGCEVAPNLKCVEVRFLGSKDQSRGLLIANVQAFVYTRGYDGCKDVNVAARKKQKTSHTILRSHRVVKKSTCEATKTAESNTKRKFASKHYDQRYTDMPVKVPWVWFYFLVRCVSSYEANTIIAQKKGCIVRY